jgi:hypothetical protein
VSNVLNEEKRQQIIALGRLGCLLRRIAGRLDTRIEVGLSQSIAYLIWAETVEASGYRRRQWKKLSRLLKRGLGEQLTDAPSHQAIVSVQTRIQQKVILAGRPSRPKPPRSERICATLSSDLLAPYVRRLLNEWLPAEAARLVNGNESTAPSDGGIPALVIGRTLEGLLVRERLSPRALEMLLQPELFSLLTFTQLMRRSCRM